MELHLSTPEAAFLAHELADRIGKPEEEVKAALLEILQPLPLRNGQHVKEKGKLAAEIMEMAAVARHCRTTIRVRLMKSLAMMN